jgi:ribosomal protein L29
MKYLTTVKNLSAGELTQKAADLSMQITKVRLERQTGKNRNVRLQFILRKQLAIIKTLLNQQSKV